MLRSWCMLGKILNLKVMETWYACVKKKTPAIQESQRSKKKTSLYVPNWSLLSTPFPASFPLPNSSCRKRFSGPWETSCACIYVHIMFRVRFYKMYFFHEELKNVTTYAVEMLFWGKKRLLLVCPTRRCYCWCSVYWCSCMTWMMARSCSHLWAALGRTSCPW